MKRSFSDRMAENIGVPKETVMNLAKLSFAENRQLYIENHLGIIEFTDELIRIKTKFSIIKISGADFKISYINDYDMMVEGIFSNITFEH